MPMAEAWVKPLKIKSDHKMTAYSDSSIDLTLEQKAKPSGAQKATQSNY